MAISSTELMNEWVKLQKEKYGEDWKSIIVKQIADQSTSLMMTLLELQKK